MGYGRTAETNRERDLQREIEDLRYEQERQREERESRQRELAEERASRREEWLEAQCHAETWEEAFAKGLPRAQAEANNEVAENWKDDFFRKWVQQIRQAQAIYTEEMASVEEQIREIRKAALWRVADRVESETGETDLAQAFRENNPEHLTNW